MFVSRLPFILGLASLLLCGNVAFAAPLDIKLPLGIDANLDLGCLLSLDLGCTKSTALQLVTDLHGKVTADLGHIASLTAKGQANIDLSGLGEAYDALVTDVNNAVDQLGAITAITLDQTDADLNAVGNLAGLILVNTMSQVGADLSLPSIDNVVSGVNNALVSLVDGLNTDLGAAVVPLIADTTAQIQADARIGQDSNIFADLWAILTS